MVNKIFRAIALSSGATIALFACNAVASLGKPILHSFAGVSQSDGSTPTGALIQADDGNFYGTTVNGGNGTDFGTVFMLTTNGQLTVLYSFTGGADGSYPDAGLVEGNDGNFYGITSGDTTDNKSGTVFKITPVGQLTTLHSFSGGSDGGHPEGRLIQASDGNFYGTTSDGGDFNAGTVFKITSDGSLTTLYSFSGGNNGGADGGYPQAGVIEASDHYLYGTTFSGGVANCGTVFHIGMDGLGYATLHAFACDASEEGMPIGGGGRRNRQRFVRHHVGNRNRNRRNDF
jgi:uncharacterized repeat protein (TIGR03803 family)